MLEEDALPNMLILSEKQHSEKYFGEKYLEDNSSFVVWWDFQLNDLNILMCIIYLDKTQRRILIIVIILLKNLWEFAPVKIIYYRFDYCLMLYVFHLFETLLF